MMRRMASGAGAALVLGLAGCSADDPEPAPTTVAVTVPAEETCGAFGDVLTIINNAGIAWREGRFADSEMNGARVLAARVQARIVAEPGTEIADALGRMQEAVQPAASGSSLRGDFTSAEWREAQDDFFMACDAEGFPPATQGWTGG